MPVCLKEESCFYNDNFILFSIGRELIIVFAVYLVVVLLDFAKPIFDFGAYVRPYDLF